MELADRFMAAITSGDVETLRDLYAPDALIWHYGGRIARIEEYADSRGSDPLRDLAAAQRAARA